MGQSSSKPLDSKVFRSTNVQVDPNLRTELETSLETDTVRQLNQDTQIEDQVAKRLFSSRQEARAALAASLEGVSELGLDRLGSETADGGDSSRDLRQQVQTLHEELTSRPRRGQLDDEGKAAREKLVECLTNHQKQPLLCREAFIAFQSEVTKAEQRIASR